MKKLVLLLVLGTASLLPAQIVNGGGASTNPTSGTIPYKNAGVFADSPLTVSGSDVTAAGNVTANSFLGSGVWSASSTPAACPLSAAGKDKICMDTSVNRLMNSYNAGAYSSYLLASDYGTANGAAQLDSASRLSSANMPANFVASPLGRRGVSCWYDPFNGSISCQGALVSGSIQAVGGGTITNASATAPPTKPFNTTGVISTAAGWKFGGNQSFAIGTGLYYFDKSSIDSVLLATNIRTFWGFSDQSTGNQVASDVPAGNYVGIMASTTGTYTGLTDTTHFVCVTKNNTTQVAVNSTVLFDTAAHTFEVIEATGGGSWTFKIDSTAVCGTMSATLPASGTGVGPSVALIDLAASARAIDDWYFVVATDK